MNRTLNVRPDKELNHNKCYNETKYVYLRVLVQQKLIVVELDWFRACLEFSTSIVIQYRLDWLLRKQIFGQIVDCNFYIFTLQMKCGIFREVVIRQSSFIICQVNISIKDQFLAKTRHIFFSSYYFFEIKNCIILVNF